MTINGVIFLINIFTYSHELLILVVLNIKSLPRLILYVISLEVLSKEGRKKIKKINETIYKRIFRTEFNVKQNKKY